VLVSDEYSSRSKRGLRTQTSLSPEERNPRTSGRGDFKKGELPSIRELKGDSDDPDWGLPGFDPQANDPEDASPDSGVAVETSAENGWGWCPPSKTRPHGDAIGLHQTDVPDGFVWKRMVTGYPLAEADPDRFPAGLQEALLRVTENGYLALQRLGNSKLLSDTEAWLARISGITAALDDRFPWMRMATERIRNHLIYAARFALPLQFPPLVLLGPHGIGKTRIK